jgi:hypothetical protein
MVTHLTLTQVFQVRALIGHPFINCGYSIMLITSVFQTENPSWILGTRSKKIGFVLELADITVLETVSERSESSSLSRPTNSISGCRKMGILFVWGEERLSSILSFPTILKNILFRYDVDSGKTADC